jgi:DNA-binding CsgD family transcriptional regulator
MQLSCSTHRVSDQNPIGLVLLNEELDPLYLNSIAGCIFCYPALPDFKTRLMKCAIERPQCGFLAEVRESREVPFQVVSGKRHYLCQVLFLGPHNEDKNEPSFGILLERSSRRNEHLRRLFEEFKLSPRERQAVLLLADGLNTEEIAKRMKISPHTVKVFLHFVMVKLGVTSRSGVIARMTRGATRTSKEDFRRLAYRNSFNP